MWAQHVRNMFLWLKTHHCWWKDMEEDLHELVRLEEAIFLMVSMPRGSMNGIFSAER